MYTFRLQHTRNLSYKNDRNSDQGNLVVWDPAIYGRNGLITEGVCARSRSGSVPHFFSSAFFPECAIDAC